MAAANVLALADCLREEREFCQQVFPAAGLVVELLPNDLADAVRRVQDLRPALVVTRIRPGRVGIELLRAMRADAVMAVIPVLVLTSNPMPRVHAEARTAGADEVVLLPIPPDDLCALAWGLIRSGRSSSGRARSSRA